VLEDQDPALHPQTASQMPFWRLIGMPKWITASILDSSGRHPNCAFVFSSTGSFGKPHANGIVWLELKMPKEFVETSDYSEERTVFYIDERKYILGGNNHEKIFGFDDGVISMFHSDFPSARKG
jgi:hypothetical protein